MAAALESLCASYWYPLYAYARRLGHPVPEAQDLTQGFFSRLLERHYLRKHGKNAYYGQKQAGSC